MKTPAAVAALVTVAVPFAVAYRPEPILRTVPNGSYGFAFWNVENLFDTDDDPGNDGDDEYLPKNGWTAELYRTKLDRLAGVVAEVAPHVLGLAEVENRRVVEDLFAHPKLAGMGFRIAHRDTPDKRGIDLALAFRAPFELATGDAGVELHPITMDGQPPTRGVLEVPLRMREGTTDARLTVLVNHWPSRGGDRDGAFRQVAGVRVREVVDRIVAAEESAGRDGDVLLLGDFNDDPFDRSIQEALGAIRSRNAVLHRRDVRSLYNPSWALLAEPDRGTLYYNADWVWNVFDQVIVTKGMIAESAHRGLCYVEGSLDVYAPDALRDRHRRPLRFRRDRDGSWQKGYSDHFLIHGRLELR